MSPSVVVQETGWSLPPSEVMQEVMCIVPKISGTAICVVVQLHRYRGETSQKERGSFVLLGVCRVVEHDAAVGTSLL